MGKGVCEKRVTEALDGARQMTAATINKINASIAKHGVEIVKGDGYFYFADLSESPEYNADQITSVFSCTLRCMSLEDWVSHVESGLA
jgi:hypothetical protein